MGFMAIGAGKTIAVAIRVRGFDSSLTTTTSIMILPMFLSICSPCKPTKYPGREIYIRLVDIYNMAAQTERDKIW